MDTPAASAPAPDPHAGAPAHRDIVVVGASAGGVSALQQLAAGLPRDYPGALFAVVHVSPGSDSSLHEIIARAGPLPALRAEDGMPIRPGRWLVAPPDRHLLVERGRVRVVRGPRENRHRPAIDPLFRSAAWSHGPRAVGVVLTGHLDDGTAGLFAIKSCGGTTVVQDPADAQHAGMPASALRNNRIDHCLPLAGIARLLVRLAHEPVDDAPMAAPGLGDEVGLARLQARADPGAPLGAPTAFTCPTCRGALWELDEGGHLRYRCHTGHAFSQDSLLLEQGTDIEHSLYTALRAVEEKSAALRHLAERWSGRFPRMHADYEERARELDLSADALRRLLGNATA